MAESKESAEDLPGAPKARVRECERLGQDVANEERSLPQNLDAVLQQLIQYLHPQHGKLFIYLPFSSACYHQIHDCYNHIFHPDARRYLAAEDIVTSAKRLGLEFEMQTLEFDHVISQSNESLLAYYLQKCVLEEHDHALWNDHATLAEILARYTQADTWSFPQQLAAIWLSA